MKNSNLFLLILCLFLFAQSGLLLGSQRQRNRKKSDDGEQGTRRRSQRRRRRTRPRRVNGEERTREEGVIEEMGETGGTRTVFSTLFKKRFRGKKRGRKKRVEEGFHSLVSEESPVQEDRRYTLTELDDNEGYTIAVIKLFGSDAYLLVYNKDEQFISIRDISEESGNGLSDQPIENIGSAEHYKIESGRYLFVKTDYCEKFQDYTLKIFDLSEGFDEVVQTIKNVKSFEIALEKYLFVTNYGRNSCYCKLKIFDLSEGSGKAIETIERCRSYKIVLKKYVIVEDDYVYTQGISGELLRCIRLQIFDLSKSLVRPIKTIECEVKKAHHNGAVAYKIESEKYLCVRVSEGGFWGSRHLMVYDLSKGCKYIKKIEAPGYSDLNDCSIVGNYLFVKTDTDMLTCHYTLKIFDLSKVVRETIKNLIKNVEKTVVFMPALSESLARPTKTIENVESYKIKFKEYLFVRTKDSRTSRGYELKIFDLSVGLDRPVQTIQNIWSWGVTSKKYLYIRVDHNLISRIYTLKIFDLSKNSEGLDEPIKTIENVRLRYSRNNYKTGYRIIGNNLIVISGSSEEESQLQIFNLEQLERAIQQDEEEEGETSNTVGQEYSTAPIFTCVGAVGFAINDGLVSVKFSDGSIESNVFELDGGEVVAPDFPAEEVMAPSFPLEVEGPNFGYSEARVQSVGVNLKDFDT